MVTNLGNLISLVYTEIGFQFNERERILFNSYPMRDVIEKCEFSVLFPKTPKFANVDCVYISPYLHTMQVLV